MYEKTWFTCWIFYKFCLWTKKTTIEVESHSHENYLKKFFRKLLLNKNDIIRIGKGFHSYSTECGTDYTYNTIFVCDKKGCYIGYYERSSKIVLAKCTIPKGSKYLINRDGEIVSNRIIINSVEKIWKVVSDQPSFIGKPIGDWGNS